MKPKILTETVFFLRWDALPTRTGPCLMMTVLQEANEKVKAPKPLAIQVPNEKGSRGLAPPQQVESLAGQLKVGDKVEVTYQKSGMRLLYKMASAAGGTSDGTADEFTFVRRHRVRLGRNSYNAIIAGRGSLTWTFVVPDKAMADAGVGEAEADLLQKIQACERGKKVRLTYDPHKFFFWLKDLETVAAEDATAKAG